VKTTIHGYLFCAFFEVKKLELVAVKSTKAETKLNKKQ
jgi:hypothetical protein